MPMKRVNCIAAYTLALLGTGSVVPSECPRELAATLRLQNVRIAPLFCL
jgi:hypothetical protein